MRTSKLLLASIALLAGSIGRADTIDVSATTLLNVESQTRGPGPDPSVATVAPIFEIISITASDVRNPVADDLTIAVSTWGSYELNDRRWDTGTHSDLNGDVVTGYVQGKLLDRRLTFRLGRAQVQTGVARMIHLDGGQVIGRIPFGLSLSAYAGVPVSERFSTRTGFRNWNPLGGDFAYGGRLAYSLSKPGSPGRGLDVGLSANIVQNSGDAVKQEVGADLRWKLAAPVTITGFGAYSLFDERFSEGQVRAGWNATRKLFVEADYHFVAPDLFLSRDSILSVFSSEERHQFGGGGTYKLGHGLLVGANYHLELQPGSTGTNNDYFGHEADARVEWTRGPTLVGLEGFFLDTFYNGYWGGRLYGKRELGRAFAAADVLAHFFRDDINGESYALTGTLSVGYELLRGFSAVVAGRAGVTPFLENTFDVIAKLVYGQTYRRTEVR
jgi:hypothetical protein